MSWSIKSHKMYKIDEEKKAIVWEGSGTTRRTVC